MTQGASSMFTSPCPIMLPQLSRGGCTPRPRKLSPASARIAVAIQTVAVTRTVPEIPGKMYERHQAVAPSAQRPPRVHVGLLAQRERGRPGEPREARDERDADARARC